MATSKAYVLLVTLTVFLYSMNVGRCQDELNNDEKQATFDLFDSDGNGQISLKELEQILTKFGEFTSEQELKDEIAAVDQNGDGMINYAEFVLLLNRILLKDTVAKVEGAFHYFDEDGNGFVTKTEFKDIMTGLGQKLSDSEVVTTIKDADIDGDGELNFEEFIGLFGSSAKFDDAVRQIDNEGLRNDGSYGQYVQDKTSITDNVYKYTCDVKCISGGLFIIILTIGLSVMTLISLYKQCNSENKL